MSRGKIKSFFFLDVLNSWHKEKDTNISRILDFLVLGKYTIGERTTPYKAISAPVIPEMMYASWNEKKFVLGKHVMEERGLRTGDGKKKRGEQLL